jgi:adenine/guanine/hypoxanthine permease
LGAAGVSADKVIDALGNNGVLYHGMSLLGGGAVLAGLILGAMAAFIIDRDFNRAAIYSLAGAMLAFFGFIHGVRLSWMAEWQVALGYALFAVICYVVGVRESAVAAEPAAAKVRAAE